MKILKFCLAILLALSLSACKVTKKIELESSRETILAFAVADDKLYGVGKLHSYQFKYPRDLKKFMKNLDTSKLEMVGIDDIQYNVETQKISTVLRFRFKDEGKRSVESFVLKNGEIVELANRDEILKIGKLKYPMKAIFKPYKTESERSAEPLLIPFIIPFKLVELAGIALILPFISDFNIH